MEEKLTKYFSGESSLDEIEEVHSWRSESESNAFAFLEAKKIWLGSEEIPKPDNSILENILKSEEDNEAQNHSLKITWWKYAAAAIVLFTVGFFLFNNNSDIKGQKLSDGSEISFHGESYLKSINITEGIREVELVGKAYFDIERDERRPFVIITENARVEVLGTSFVIDSDNSKTEVSVESGLVSLVKPGGQGRTDLSVKLSEGEMGTVNTSNSGIIKRNNSNANYLAWKTKTLTFQRAKMSEVENVLEDVYGIDVQFENENLKNCNLTAKFKERKAKDAIEIIAKTFNLTFEMRKEKVVLKGKGC